MAKMINVCEPSPEFMRDTIQWWVTEACYWRANPTAKVREELTEQYDTPEDAVASIMDWALREGLEWVEVRTDATDVAIRFIGTDAKPAFIAEVIDRVTEDVADSREFRYVNHAVDWAHEALGGGN